MDIALWFVRQFIIYYVRYVIDINTTCGNVGSDQYPGVAVFEILQCALPSGLSFVAVNYLSNET